MVSVKNRAFFGHLYTFCTRRVHPGATARIFLVFFEKFYLFFSLFFLKTQGIALFFVFINLIQKKCKTGGVFSGKMGSKMGKNGQKLHVFAHLCITIRRGNYRKTSFFCTCCAQSGKKWVKKCEKKCIFLSKKHKKFLFFTHFFPKNLNTEAIKNIKIK